ncbi:ead/Ea22-like family protein [Escherichia coli]|nr:ead/Ea22-like family protein [Escherichia coli]
MPDSFCAQIQAGVSPMTALNKQALRQLATDAHELGIIKRYTKGIEANKRFAAIVTPLTVLALLDELEAAEKRIAELEARTVTLPQRLQPGADGYDDWYVHSADDGEYLKVDDVIEAIRDAGIKVKGE